jgi:hypothetical protein
VNVDNLILGYIFAHGGVLYAAMSFACESSIAVCTTGSIVMNMNVQEHRSRVLVQARGRVPSGRAASPDPAH